MKGFDGAAFLRSSSVLDHLLRADRTRPWDGQSHPTWHTQLALPWLSALGSPGSCRRVRNDVRRPPRSNRNAPAPIQRRNESKNGCSRRALAILCTLSYLLVGWTGYFW